MALTAKEEEMDSPHILVIKALIIAASARLLLSMNVFTYAGLRSSHGGT
jgi:hypothetical protein